MSERERERGGAPVVLPRWRCRRRLLAVEAPARGEGLRLGTGRAHGGDIHEWGKGEEEEKK